MVSMCSSTAWIFYLNIYKLLCRCTRFNSVVSCAHMYHRLDYEIFHKQYGPTSGSVQLDASFRQSQPVSNWWKTREICSNANWQVKCDCGTLYSTNETCSSHYKAQEWAGFHGCWWKHGPPQLSLISTTANALSCWGFTTWSNHCPQTEGLNYKVTYGTI